MTFDVELQRLIIIATICLGIVIAVLMLIADQRIGRIRASHRRLRDELEIVQRRLDTLLSLNDQYQPTDPAPFTEPVQQLQRVLTQIQAQHISHYHAYARLRTELQVLVDNLGLLAWHRFLPLDRRLWRNYGLRAQPLAAFAQSLTEAEKLCQQLRTLPRTVQHDCWKVAEQSQQVAGMLDALSALGLRGASLKQARDELAGIHASLSMQRQALRRVPDALFDASSTVAIEAEHKHVIAQAWDAVVTHRPALSRLERTGQRWRDLNIAISGALRAASSALDNAEKLLPRLAPMLDPQPFTDRYHTHRRVLGGLLTDHQTLDIARIDTAAQAAQDHATTAQDFEQQLQQLVNDVDALRGLLPANRKRLDASQHNVTRLAAEKVNKVIWTVTAPALAALDRRQHALGAPDDRRSPSVLAQHLAEAREIDKDLGSVGSHIGELEQAQRQLFTILAQSDLPRTTEWLSSIEQLASQVRSYASANWPTEVQATSLRGDADDLARRQRQLQTVLDGAGIPEGEYRQQVSALSRVLDDLRSLRKREAAIAAQLQQIRDQERQAQETLRSLKTEVGTISLGKSQWMHVAVAGQLLNQLSKLVERTKQLEQALQNPLDGTVAAKSDEVVALARSYRAVEKEILHQCEVDATTLSAQVAANLRQLRASARLARQPELHAADDLLAPQQASGSGSALSPTLLKQARQLNERCGELRQVNEQLMKLLKTLQQAIDQHNKKFQATQAAITSLGEAYRLTRTSWSFPIDDEKDSGFAQELEELAGQIRSAKQSDTLRDYQRSMTAVDRKVDGVAQGAKDALDRVHERLAELEKHYATLQNWVTKLEAYAVERPEEQDLQQAMNNYVYRLNTLLQPLKNEQSRSRGRLEYQHVVRDLKRAITDAQYQGVSIGNRYVLRAHIRDDDVVVIRHSLL